MAALATVLRRPIVSVYPYTNGLGDAYAKTANTVLEPLRNTSQGREPLFIMWTRTSPRIGSIWMANHFVPLVKGALNPIPSPLSSPVVPSASARPHAPTLVVPSASAHPHAPPLVVPSASEDASIALQSTSFDGPPQAESTRLSQYIIREHYSFIFCLDCTLFPV